MTRHDTHHDKLKQEVTEVNASLKDFKEVRQGKEDDPVTKTSDHQANRMY